MTIIKADADAHSISQWLMAQGGKVHRDTRGQCPSGVCGELDFEFPTNRVEFGSPMAIRIDGREYKLYSLLPLPAGGLWAQVGDSNGGRWGQPYAPADVYNQLTVPLTGPGAVSGRAD